MNGGGIHAQLVDVSVARDDTVDCRRFCDHIRSGLQAANDAFTPARDTALLSSQTGR